MLIFIIKLYTIKNKKTKIKQHDAPDYICLGIFVPQLAAIISLD